MIRGYIAQSADGYVADREGGVGFLDPFQTDETGVDYAAFIETIGTVVMGRTTYDQVVEFDVGWPYEGKRTIVVTSRPLDGSNENAAPGAPEVWSDSMASLARHLQGGTGRDGDRPDGDAWIVGGPRLQTAFLQAGHLDRLELFVMPVLLGGGVRLFEAETTGPTLELRDATTLPKGIVKLDYAVGSKAE